MKAKDCPRTQTLSKMRAKTTSECMDYIDKVLPSKITALTEWCESLQCEVSNHLSDTSAYFSPSSVADPRTLARLRKRIAATGGADDEDDSDDDAGEEMTGKKRSRPQKKPKMQDDSGSEQLVTLPSHKGVLAMIPPMKKEVQEMVKMCSALKLWITLNIPKIDSGDNFGVGVQEEVLNELTRTEESGYVILDSITKYFLTRAKLLTQVAKFAEIEDFHQVVMDLDQKELYGLRLCALDLRNMHVQILDVINKNWDKIRKPRNSENSANLY